MSKTVSLAVSDGVLITTVPDVGLGWMANREPSVVFWWMLRLWVSG